MQNDICQIRLNTLNEFIGYCKNIEQAKIFFILSEEKGSFDENSIDNFVRDGIGKKCWNKTVFNESWEANRTMRKLSYISIKILLNNSLVDKYLVDKYLLDTNNGFACKHECILNAYPIGSNSEREWSNDYIKLYGLNTKKEMYQCFDKGGINDVILERKRSEVLLEFICSKILSKNDSILFVMGKVAKDFFDRHDLWSKLSIVFPPENKIGEGRKEVNWSKDFRCWKTGHPSRNLSCDFVNTIIEKIKM